MKRDLMPFLQALLRNPRQIGAVAPAGRALCSAMVREVLGRPPGLVIELGAGTGSITAALRRHHQDVPLRVVINECIELAKSFGGTDGHKYVNGVLHKLGQKLRAAEAGLV